MKTKMFLVGSMIILLFLVACNSTTTKEQVTEEVKVIKLELSNQYKGYLKDTFLLQVMDSIQPLRDQLYAVDTFLVYLLANVSEESPLYEEITKLQWRIEKIKKDNEKILNNLRDSLKNEGTVMVCKNELQRADDFFENGNYEKALVSYQRVNNLCNSSYAVNREAECTNAIEQKRIQAEQKRIQDSIASLPPPPKKTRKEIRQEKKQQKEASNELF